MTYLSRYLRDAGVAGAIVFLLYAGYVKGSPFLSGVPVDLTVVAATIVLVFTVGSLLVTRLVGGNEIGRFVMLFASFVPALLWTSGNSYADEKTVRLFLVTGFAMLAVVVLVRTRTRALWLVFWFVVAGIAIAVLARLAPSAETFGRASAEGSNTIALGRAAGAGVIGLVTLVYAGRMRIWIGGPLVLSLIGSAFASGSRGPLVAVFFSVVLAAVANGYGRRGLARGAVVAVVAAISGVGIFSRTNPAAADRISFLFAADRGESVNFRIRLIKDFLSSMWLTPWGTGWGDATENVPTYGDAGYRVYPHNLVLEVFSDGGLLAGLVLISTLMVSVRALWYRASDPLAAGLFALLVYWLVNALVSGDINDNRSLFALMGLALVSPTIFNPVDDEQYGAVAVTGESAGNSKKKFPYKAGL